MPVVSTLFTLTIKCHIKSFLLCHSMASNQISVKLMSGVLSWKFSSCGVRQFHFAVKPVQNPCKKRKQITPFHLFISDSIERLSLLSPRRHRRQILARPVDCLGALLFLLLHCRRQWSTTDQTDIVAGGWCQWWQGQVTCRQLRWDREHGTVKRRSMLLLLLLLFTFGFNDQF